MNSFEEKMEAYNAQQEKTNRDSEKTMKMKSTQNIIRNKYKEAFMNRIADEPRMDSFAKIEPETSDIKSNRNQTRISMKNGKIHHMSAKNINSKHDVNQLCERLRLLMLTFTEGDENNISESKNIISKLRELEIIV